MIGFLQAWPYPKFVPNVSTFATSPTASDKKRDDAQRSRAFIRSKGKKG